MGLSYYEKFKILLKASKIIKNWYEIPNIYLGFTKKEEIILEMKNKLNITIRNTLSDIMQFTTVWLFKDYEHKDFEIKNGDIIIDIGSHIGLFSLYASQKCKEGKIFSFEPVKSNYNIFLKNIEKNNLKNIFSFNTAVAKETGLVKINLHEDESGHSLFKTGGESITVESISLKEIIEKNSIEKCDLIKMDCEGGEYEIIDSIPDKYIKKINKFIIEYHFEDKKPQLVIDLIKKLKSNSFEIEKHEWKNGMGLIYAKNQEIRK